MKKKKEQQEQHPILNQVLTPEFLKQFKDSGELNSFMEQLYARAMEQMLEGEMDSHLGYEKQIKLCLQLYRTPKQTSISK